MRRSQLTHADAIASRGATLENCFGFVDGTVRRKKKSKNWDAEGSCSYRRLGESHFFTRRSAHVRVRLPGHLLRVHMQFPLRDAILIIN